MKFVFGSDDLEVLHGILEESSEHLRGVEQGILKLEACYSPEVLDEVFRAIHSVKGVVGFLELTPLIATSHALESILVDMRNSLYLPDEEITDVLLKGADILSNLVKQFQERLSLISYAEAADSFELEIDDLDYERFVSETENMRQARREESNRPEQAKERAGEALNRLPEAQILGQIMQDFLGEAAEHLEKIEETAIRFDRGEFTQDEINELMRCFHSIKGACGVVLSVGENLPGRTGIELMGRLSHAVETFLVSAKKGDLDRNFPDIILEVKDRLAHLLAAIAQEDEKCEPIDDLLARIGRLTGSGKEAQNTKDKNKKMLAFMNQARQVAESLENVCAKLKEEGKVTRRRWQQIERGVAGLASSAQMVGDHHVAAACDRILTLLRDIQSDPGSKDILDWLLESVDALVMLIELNETAAKNEPETDEDYGTGTEGRLLGEILLDQGKITMEELAEALARQRRKIGEILAESGKVSREDIEQALAIQQAERQKTQEETRTRPAPEVASQSVRVSQEKLDLLMNMIGELLITRNRLAHLAGSIGRGYDQRSLTRELKNLATELSGISNRLQDAIMSVRLRPLSTLFQRYHRSVRDIARQTGKQVELLIEGEETELDKTIIEAINDPLTHLIRNAIDHGIEPPKQRQSLGKPLTGTVKLKAYYQGSQVIIEVSDDGQGLNEERIREKAVEKGIISENEAAGLSREEIWQLIFLPGFSTRDQATDLSGRGVGMDVVKNNIENVGGTVLVQSFPGQGSRFILSIPITTAVMKGLMVEAGQQNFIIPVDSVHEMVKIPVQNIKTFKDNYLADIRGEVLPLLDLGRILMDRESDWVNTGKRVCVAVVEVGGLRYGLLVDRFLGQQEFVVKALDEGLAAIRLYTGATILGDGRVALILNVAQIIQMRLAREAGGEANVH